MSDNKNYRELIRNIPDFPKPGIDFIDWLPILRHPEAFHQLMDDIVAALPCRFTKIAALEARGFLLAIPMAERWNVPMVPIRKRGKLPGTCLAREYELEYGTAAIEVQSDAIQASDHVLIVDDLLATGGTMNAANRLVQSITPHVEDFFFIELEALKGGQKLKVPYHTLLHL